MIGVRLAGLLPLAASLSSGQPAPVQPSFEVASVKVAAPGADARWHRISTGDSGRVTYTGVTLRFLLMRAYEVKDYQIAGPAWLMQERYDIDAKIPVDTPREQVPAMLQNLLAERFQMTLHHELRETNTYALTAAKGGLKLKPVEDTKDGVSFGVGPGGQKMNGKLSLSSLASLLSSLIGTPVLDATGIEGTFDFNLQWTPDDRQQGIMQWSAQGGAGNPPEAAASTPGPSLFAALQEIGLKLETRKAPLDTLVIDHADKIPTEN